MFVCHGNICRSPMAEFLFKKLIEEKGVKNDYLVLSSATSTEELGNPVYPPVARILKNLNIDYYGKRSVQLKASDYENYDYFIGMDDRNIYNMKRIFGIDKSDKIYKLLEFTGSTNDVADPWYTGEFQTTYNDVLKGVTALYEFLNK